MSSPVGKNQLINETASIDEKIKFVIKNAKVGDVMLFHRQSQDAAKPEPDNFYPGHVGVYIGDGKYIDARYNRGDVSIVDITKDAYMNCFVGIKSILDKTPATYEKNRESF